MIKKYKIIVALLIVGLVSSMFATTVGASASAGDVEKENSRYVYQGKVNKERYMELEQYVRECLAKWDINWKEYNKRTDVVEQPVEKAPEQEVEQPVEQPEQPEAPVEKAPEQVEEQPTEPEQNNNENEASELNEFEQQVFALTNEERAKHGLNALQVDYEVSKVAREKSRDMAVNNYFDHNSPTYGSPFDMLKAYGINYQSAGENIAKGQRTPQEVVNAWMNSEGHRANILNGSYTHIGVGYVEQGNHWTQQFIGK